ncbi:MAG: hypothetical protein HGB06_05310 [Chlorobaculum sp.]|nr:hypothetical protein [Chlorobaculum sp.]
MIKQMKLKLPGLAVLLLSASPAMADEAIIHNMSGSHTNIAQITQYGGIFNANYAEIYQDYDALNEHAYITQAGAGNQYAYLYQNGDGNEVNITQNGIHGAAFVYESYYCFDSTATIIQDFNTANAYALIDQNTGYGYGYNNSAYIFQNSLTGDVATIIHHGGSNNASIRQEINVGMEIASSTQTGDFNSAIISQTYGASDQIIIQQSGSGNQSAVQQLSTYLCNASVDQNGTSNIASIDQTGSFKVATVTQTGSANSIAIVQH